MGVYTLATGRGGLMKRTNDRLVNIVIEVSERLADEEDYDEYLRPKLEYLLEFLIDTYPDLKVVEESR
jgi:hypothetical protein